jgi:hypothetical protein
VPPKMINMVGSDFTLLMVIVFRSKNSRHKNQERPQFADGFFD